MLSTVTTKGQVTIPKTVRGRLGIRPNDRVDFLVKDDHAILVPVKPLSRLRGAMKVRAGSSLAAERRAAKRAVAARVKEELLS